MKIEKITYQQTFPTGNFMNQKLGMEISLEETDQGEERLNHAFEFAKSFCEETFKKLNPHAGEVVTYGDSNVVGEYSQNGNTIGSGIATTTSPKVKEKRKEEVVASLMLAIELAQTKKATEFFRKRVEDVGDENLTAAFEEKIKQFV